MTAFCSRPAGALLLARSRAVPLALASLAAVAVLAVWAAYGLDAHLDPGRLVPVVALAPLMAAAVIGTGLHTPMQELERAAVRPWWPRRLVQSAGLTAFASALLALAVIFDDGTFGPAAMVRNILGAVGVTAAASAVIGARLSWLPAFAYLSAVYLGAPRAHGGAAQVWAWPMQPGDLPGAWATALAAFVLGVTLHACRGPA
ncbi:hypothetical protein J7E88_08350 [Streptomyces sp. ISL-10]|uniref:hypothetical protein n=1 Tax=Streptomyces sp. ISL-10 TaxID=2819172 RepID=UPI001BE5B4CF|nr:hypothetical protein [Streptomyces sp. ISL-10]MBT2365332.1 hypothetical protein [Streptomyces sp. ISL-10]